MSKSTTGFADLGKAPSDLLNKGFPAASTIKVSHEGSIPFGVLFKNALASKTDGSKVNLTIEPEYKTALGDNQVSFKGKWTSGDELEGSASVADLITPGTEVKGWFARGPNAKTKEVEAKGGVQCSFANDTFNVNVKTDHPSDFSKHKIDATIVAHAPQNIYWGVNLQFAHTPKKDSEDDKKAAAAVYGRLHYAQPNGKGSVTVAYEPDAKSKDDVKVPQLSFTWFQKYDDMNFATSFVIPPAKSPYAVVVTDQKYDSSTSVKSKFTIGTENRVGVAYTHTMNPYMVGTVGIDLNANKLVGGSGGGDHAFGFEVKLK